MKSLSTIKQEADKILNKKPIYKPVSWSTKVELIKRLLLQNKNILISIVADQGDGKTTFAHLLGEELQEQANTCVLNGAAILGREQLTREIAAQLDFNIDCSLEQLVDKIQSSEINSLVIVDNAHYLPAELIDELLSLIQKQSSKSYFHLCLLSNYALLNLLNALEQTKYPDLIHGMEIGHLSENETRTYIKQRMQVKPESLNDEQIKDFYLLTGGDIGSINRQMKDFFDPTENIGPVVKNRYVISASAILVMVVTALVLSLILKPYSKQLLPEKINTIEKLVYIKQSPDTVEPKLISSLPTYFVSASRVTLEATPIRKAELLSLSDEDDEGIAAEAMAVVDRVLVAPKVILSEEGLNKRDIEPVALLENEKLVPATSEAKRPQNKPSIVANRIAQYTIQLIASRNQSELLAFMQKYNLQSKTHIYKTLGQSQGWYVLTYGSYPEKQAAALAVTRLPLNLANLKPWVRTLSDLKKI